MNMKAKVMTPEGTILEFLTDLGILQGDVPAPLLFIIFPNFILRLAIGPCDGFKIGVVDFATVTGSTLRTRVYVNMVYFSTSTRPNMLYNITSHDQKTRIKHMRGELYERIL